nr:hypothetical protein [Tanacetum cinerariifolium]
MSHLPPGPRCKSRGRAGGISLRDLEKGGVVPDDMHAVEANIPLEQVVHVLGDADG